MYAFTQYSKGGSGYGIWAIPFSKG